MKSFFRRAGQAPAPKQFPFLPLLALLAAFPPLSTDMYLPAIPILQRIWDEPLPMVNITLVGFFVSYCFFLLVYGPLSDRFGRKPPLMAGIGLFVVACGGCAMANGLTWMIVCRLLQAAGAASASTLALAISKDIFEGRARERLLAHIGIIMALAPMLAPIFGGWVLTGYSWRWIFGIQAGVGLLALAGVWRMPETLAAPVSVPAWRTASIYLSLLGNRRFVGYALMMALAVMPLFAFIGGSADIYITRMGLSEQTFGFFFGFNASAMMAGSLVCTGYLRRGNSRNLLTAGFAGIALGGLGLLLGPRTGPWAMALPMFLVTFSVGISRPPSNHLVLEQVDRYAGAASSVMVFIYFMLGAVSMGSISLDWPDKIGAIGALAAVNGSGVLLVWIFLSRNAEGRSPAEPAGFPEKAARPPVPAPGDGPGGPAV